MGRTRPTRDLYQWWSETTSVVFSLTIAPTHCNIALMFVPMVLKSTVPIVPCRLHHVLGFQQHSMHSCFYPFLGASDNCGTHWCNEHIIVQRMFLCYVSARHVLVHPWEPWFRYTSTRELYKSCHTECKDASRSSQQPKVEHWCMQQKRCTRDIILHIDFVTTTSVSLNVVVYDLFAFDYLFRTVDAEPIAQLDSGSTTTWWNNFDDNCCRIDHHAYGRSRIGCWQTLQTQLRSRIPWLRICRRPGYLGTPELVTFPRNGHWCSKCAWSLTNVARRLTAFQWEINSRKDLLPFFPLT
jgi:hypothetical protein